MSSKASTPTLQQAQTDAILRLLNLNNPIDAPTEGSPSVASGKGPQINIPPATGPPVWKILILDQRTKDVLATVLRVQDLRDVGVTLHVYVARSPLLIIMVIQHLILW